MAIRKDVESADSRDALTELYKQACGLFGDPFVFTRLGEEIWRAAEGGLEVCQTAEEEFRITARKINQRAKEIGTEADYDETWGGK